MDLDGATHGAAEVPTMFVTRPCPCCGSPTLQNDFRDVYGDVAALLGVKPGTEVSDVCERRAERELDDAEEALALADDPDFVTVCDARRDAWMAALESETAAQWASVVRLGADLLDREVAL